MKKFLIFLFLMLTSFVYGKDKVRLVNGKIIKCTVVDIELNKLTCQIKGKTVTFTGSEVSRIDLDPSNTNMIEKYYTNLDPTNPLAACEMGKADATAFHNRGFGNFCLGFFFGVFGVIGTAIGEPRSPDYVKIPVKENLNDPGYLACYKKRARGKNVGNAVAGWATLLVIVLIANN